jgi:hypothetical protein
MDAAGGLETSDVILDDDGEVVSLFEVGDGVHGRGARHPAFSFFGDGAARQGSVGSGTFDSSNG